MCVVAAVLVCVCIKQIACFNPKNGKNNKMRHTETGLSSIQRDRQREREKPRGVWLEGSGGVVTQIAQNLGKLIEKKVLACKMYCRWVTHSYMHVFIYTYTIYIYITNWSFFLVFFLHIAADFDDGSFFKYFRFLWPSHVLFFV